MSTGRNAPLMSDSRYPPERSPPRNSGGSAFRGARSASGGFGPPRGPKAFDTPRGPGPYRGRGGYPARDDFRNEYRERDRDPFRPRDLSPPPRTDDRERWRERDFDRRDQRPPMRGRPHSDFRDFRDVPPARDGDDRRPPPRDDPSPSTPYFSEFRGDFRGRGSFGRGRGRGDWDRGRRRDSFRDERDFRPRSRSPPEFRDRDGYRDEKPFDRRGSRMSDQRLEDRSVEGDEHDRFRREPYSSLDDPRRASNPSTAPSTPQPQSAGGPRPAGEPPRELNPPRRISSFATPATNKDLRPDPLRPDYLSGRPELARDRHGAGTSSPPQAPSVPAFGTFNVKSSNDLPWNVWKAPTAASESKPEKVASSPTTAVNNSVPKPLIAAPKADVERQPPTGPKAQRSMEALTEKASLVPPDSIASQREELLEQRAAQSQPSPQLGFNEKPDQTMGGMEVAQTKPISQPPTGPRATIRQDPPPKSAAQSPPLSPAALKVPTGPRASNQAVTGAFPGTPIPTAPKAIRNAPIVPFGAPAGPAAAIGPRGRLGTMPRSPEVTKVIPAKREFVGEQKFAKRADFGSSARSLEGVDTRASNGHEAILAAQIKREEPDVLTAAKTLPGENGDQATVKEGFRTGFEDEDHHLDEFDFDENEIKFQREKAVLESKKVDLGSRHLRAATPLEHLAFLSRINMEDPFVQHTLQQHAEGTPAPRAGRKTKTPAPQQPQLLETPIPAADPTPPSESPPPVLSPELDALPFLNKAPTTLFSEITAFRENEERHTRSRQLIRRKIAAQVIYDQDKEQELVPEFIANYLEWRERVDEFDNLRAEDEKEEHVVIERKPSAPPQDASPIVNPAVPAEGGRRTRGAFTTEYEMEQILKESEEMERQAQIKREREAQTAEPDMDKEAEVPTLLHPREKSVRRFQDYSQLIKQSDDTYFSYSFYPPKDDFSEQEHQTLLHNFKEYPKKFGKIAQALPYRSYKDCINHYYATKWNKEFKAPRDKRGRQRGKKAQKPNVQARSVPVSLISNLDGARPDLYDGDEFSQPIIAVTDSGRPRRAAAPTFGDKDGDDQGSSTATPEGKRRGQDRESGTEKTRRPRGTTREKSQRKPRQPAMRPREPSLSPEKSDSGLHNHNNHNPQTPVGAGNSMHSTLELEAANVLGGLHSSAEQSQTIAPSTEMGHGGFGGAEINKPLTSEQRHHKVGNSSYWSVQEVNNFPQYVSHYGTDWNAISQHMGTKSSTMVKNYYFRLINSNSKPQLKELATAADEKRAEGGNLGSPPAPAPTQHRQKRDPVRHSSTRVIMPNPSPNSTQPEVIEIDEDETPHRPPQYGMIGQSPAFSPVPRFKHVEHGHGHGRPVARAEQGDQHMQPGEIRFQPAHEPIAAVPRQGQRVAQVSEIGGPSRPILVDQTLEKQEQRRISGDGYPQLKGPLNDAWRLQSNPEPQRNPNGQDHRMLLTNPSYGGSPEAGYGKIQAPRQETERSRELETTYPSGLHRQRPIEFMPNPHETRTQPDPGPQRVTVTQPEQIKQGYSTVVSAADTQIGPHIENIPKPTAPPSRPEPQKRSNIMNILNNEPDEPAPSHSSSSRTPVQSLQSPAPPQPRVPALPQRSASNPDRQDEYADLRRGVPVSSYVTVPHPSSFTRSGHEAIHREVPMAIPQRPDWTSQVFAPSASGRQRTATRPEEKTSTAMYPEIQRYHNASPLPLGSREHVRRLSQKEQQHSPHQQPPPPVLQPEFHQPSGRPGAAPMPHLGSMSAQPVSHQRQASEGDRRAMEKESYMDRSKYDAWMSRRSAYAAEEKLRPNPALSRQDSGNKADERATSRMPMYAEPGLSGPHDVVRGQVDPLFRAQSSMQHRDPIGFHGAHPQPFSRNVQLDPRETSSKDSVTREQDRAYLHDSGRASQPHGFGEPRRMDPGMAYRHDDLDARRAAVGIDPLYPHITPAEQQQQRHREVAARAPYWRENHYGAMRPGEKPRDM